MTHEVLVQVAELKKITWLGRGDPYCVRCAVRDGWVGAEVRGGAT